MKIFFFLVIVGRIIFEVEAEVESRSDEAPQCQSNECWCISAGGNTCSWPDAETGRCDPDGCYERKDCAGNGYWCIDGYASFKQIEATNTFCKSDQIADWTTDELKSRRPDLNWYIGFGNGVCDIGNNGGVPACGKICQGIDGCEYFSVSTTVSCFACFIYKSCDSPISTDYDYKIYKMKGEMPTATTTEGGYCKADFVDPDGFNCKSYVDKKWCKPNGDYGDGWNLKHWGPFSKHEKDGKDARNCPGCGCAAQCWCVSNGGHTCQDWHDDVRFEEAECHTDQYSNKLDCYRNGYWCDDSQLQASLDLVLVDCSKYYGLDQKYVEEGKAKDYVDIDLKTYINCVQAQTTKMQSKLVATSKIIELQEETMNKMQSQIEKLIKERV